MSQSGDSSFNHIGTSGSIKMRRSISESASSLHAYDEQDPYLGFTQWPYGTPHSEKLRHGASPETPLRERRGRSGSYISPKLITPQSASPMHRQICRSFSTPSVGYPHLLDRTFPSPLGTPMETPLSTPITPTLRMPFDATVGKETLDVFRSAQTTPRAPVADDDDDAASGACGVNPFYEPPAFLRTLAAESPSVSLITPPCSAGVPSYAKQPAHSPQTRESLGKLEAVGPLDAIDSIGALNSATPRARLNPASARSPANSPHLSLSPASAAAIAAAPPTGFVYDEFAHAYPESMYSPGGDGVATPRAPRSFSVNLAEMEHLPSGCASYMPDVHREQGSPEQHEHEHERELNAHELNAQAGADAARKPKSQGAPQPQPLVDVEKPFTCETCSKAFRRIEHLKRHKKTHTNERPFACPIPECGRKFSRNDNLKAHVLTHAKKSGKDGYIRRLVEAHINQAPRRRKSGAQILA